MYIESPELLLPLLAPAGVNVDVDEEALNGANLHLEIVDVARDVVTAELRVGPPSASLTEDHRPVV